MVDFIYFFKRRYWQIRNVFRWLPVIWNQFDFDYVYSIRAFRFQLEKTANFMESDKSHTMNAKMRASKIRTAIRLMDKVYAEEYALAYFEEIERLYGKHEWFFDKDGSYVVKWDKAYSDDELGDIEIHRNKLMLECREKQVRAHKLLWAYIEHNIQTWWD